MLLAGTSTQARFGVVDDPAALEADWVRTTGAEPDAWARAFVAAQAVEVHDWLVGLGLRFGALLPEAATGARRVHVPEGGSAAIVRALGSGLDAQVRTGAWVTGLVVADGRVRGVAWRDAQNGTHTLRADAVVLATGSTLSDADRAAGVAAASPCPLDALIVGKDGALPPDADTLGFLTPLEPVLRNPDAIGTYPHVLPIGGDFPRLDVSRAIWVDGEGRRFFDEREWASTRAALAVQGLPGCVAWAVFDEPLAPDILARVPAELRAAALAGERILLHRDSVETLAAVMDADPAVLAATLDEAARTPGPGRPPAPRTPPFWAARLGLTAGKSWGGVATELDGRVLDRAGRPVPGLFAAGEFTGMGGGSLGAPFGFEGSLSPVVWSGRVAGRSAAGH